MLTDVLQSAQQFLDGPDKLQRWAVDVVRPLQPVEEPVDLEVSWVLVRGRVSLVGTDQSFHKGTQIEA